MICESCSKILSEDFNFCPYCGKAVTQTAIELQKEHKKVTELSLIANMIDLVKDKQTLIMLKKLSEKISE